MEKKLDYNKIRMSFFFAACDRFEAMGLDDDEATKRAVESTEKYMKTLYSITTDSKGAVLEP